MKTKLRGEKGITLIEMMVVIAIIGILAGIVAGVTAGITTSAKGSKKDTDIKAVEDAAARYNTDVGSVSVTESSEPSTIISDTDDDGTITVKLTVTGANDPGDFPISPDVTCSGATVEAAIHSCFGTVDFTVLVPVYIADKPPHSGETVAFALTNGADLTITDVDRLGNDMAIYSDTAVASSAGFSVWNLSGTKAYVMIDSGYYGAPSQGN